MKEIKTVNLSEDNIPVNEEVFRKFVNKYGAMACNGWLSGECSKCIEDGVSNESIQFNCEEYRQDFDFAEALANAVG